MKENSETTKTRTRVLVIDDHPLLRQGIIKLINSEKDFEVCGEAEDAHKGLAAIATAKPDIVTIDISLKGTNGIELLKNIKARYPKLMVLVISMHDEAIYAQRALKAGAAGYVMKQEAPDRVMNALRRIRSGEAYVSERLGSRMLNQLVGGKTAAVTGSPIDELSDRELEVFNLIGQGHGTRPIAEKLHLSVKTVESHRAHIKEKLNLKSSTELVHHAIQWVQSEALGQ